MSKKIICGSCQSTVNDSQNFCGECGAELKPIGGALPDAILKEPDIAKAYKLKEEGKEKEAEKIFKQWEVYSSGIFKIVGDITGMTGDWYVGKTKGELREKIKAMPPKSMQTLRSKLAAMLKKAKAVEKVQLGLKAEANGIVSTLLMR